MQKAEIFKSPLIYKTKAEEPQKHCPILSLSLSTHLIYLSLSLSLYHPNFQILQTPSFSFSKYCFLLLLLLLFSKLTNFSLFNCIFLFVCFWFVLFPCWLISLLLLHFLVLSLCLIALKTMEPITKEREDLLELQVKIFIKFSLFFFSFVLPFFMLED